MKKLFALILLIVVLAVSIYLGFFDKKTLDKPTIKDTIEGFDYNLYSNQSKEYKQLFNSLKEILTSNKIDYEEYAKLISQMFIMDFYTLDNKMTNLNIGGEEFVYSGMIDNFKLNAKNTLYKYVKSNIYGDRKQELPIVTKVNIDEVNIITFYYNDTKDTKCYEVKVSWEYKKDLGYDTNKYLYFVHEDKKLTLVEVSDEKA